MLKWKWRYVHSVLILKVPISAGVRTVATASFRSDCLGVSAAVTEHRPPEKKLCFTVEQYPWNIYIVCLSMIYEFFESLFVFVEHCPWNTLYLEGCALSQPLHGGQMFEAYRRRRSAALQIGDRNVCFYVGTKKPAM